MRFKQQARGYRRREAVGVWLGSGSDLCGEEPDMAAPVSQVDSSLQQTLAPSIEIARYFSQSHEARRAEAPAEGNQAPAQAALAVNSSISWNASTTVVKTLQRRMRKQGWQGGQATEIPCYEGEAEPLPRRPLDLGVGLWRQAG